MAVADPGPRPGELTRMRVPAVKDARPALIVYVVCLYLIPSDLVVPALGAAGTPAQIVGYLLLAWWFASRIAAPPGQARRTPVHWLLLVLASVLLVSYVAGMTRPITGVEVSSSDRALLSLGAWCGVALVVTDGLAGRERLESLLRLVAASVTVIAVLGYLQFFFDLDLARMITFPGLEPNSGSASIFERSGYARVSGTTRHPIEFGVVLAAGLPLVAHCARFASTTARARTWWVCTALVAAALPLSVARSAILGGVVAVVMLLPTWPGALRKRAMVAIVVGAMLMSLVVPGLLGTIRSLFLNASTDPSAQGRTADYQPVLDYVRQAPLLGRGFGTFIPDLYRTLDNQYLGITVESGLLGLAGVLTLLVGSVVVAGRARAATTDERTRHLLRCLQTGIVVIAMNAAFFDAFGFPMCVGTLFLLVGAVGLVHGASRRELPAVRASAGAARAGDGGSDEPPRGARPRPAALALAGILAFSLLGGWASSLAPHIAYETSSTALLAPPQNPNEPAFSRAGNATTMTSLIHDAMQSRAVRDSLRRRVPGHYEVAIGDASAMPGTDIIGYGPTLRLVAIAATPSEAASSLRAVKQEAARRLERLQSEAGVPRSEAITLSVDQVLAPREVAGRPSRALGASLLLTGLVVVSWLSATRAGSGGRHARRSPHLARFHSSRAVRRIGQTLAK